MPKQEGARGTTARHARGIVATTVVVTIYFALVGQFVIIACKGKFLWTKKKKKSRESRRRHFWGRKRVSFLDFRSYII